MILLHSNEMICYNWNAYKTYDTTPQRDLHFYRNELDMLHESTITWKPNRDMIR